MRLSGTRAVEDDLGVGLDGLDGLSDADLDDFLAGPADAPADAIESLLARHAAALADLRCAGGLDRSSFGADYRARPDSLPADELSGQLRARRVLAADARLALAIGDRARFLADLRAVAAQHRALLGEPAFIFQIIGRAVEAGFHDLVRDLLASETADPALLAAAAAEIDASDPQASLAAAFAVEAFVIPVLGTVAEMLIPNLVDARGPNIPAVRELA